MYAAVYMSCVWISASHAPEDMDYKAIIGVHFNNNNTHALYVTLLYGTRLYRSLYMHLWVLR
jgi:hypothetical protein